MRKRRDDSTWNRLTPEQRERLESWLFDENLGYAATLARVRDEFGIEASLASLGRYYRRRARERQAGELLEAQHAAEAFNQLPVSTDDLRTAAVKLVGKAVLRLAGEQPERLDQLAALTRLLLESADADVRRARLRLAEKCFEFEATAAIQKELPQLRAFLAGVSGDASLGHEEKLRRVHAVLYGWNHSELPRDPAAPASGIA